MVLLDSPKMAPFWPSFKKYWVIDNQWIGFWVFIIFRKPKCHGRCEYGEPEGLERLERIGGMLCLFVPLGTKHR
jgi:hypothetical protein